MAICEPARGKCWANTGAEPEELPGLEPDIVLYQPWWYDGGELYEIGKEYSDGMAAYLKQLLSKAGADEAAVYEIDLPNSQYVVDSTLRLMEILYPELMPQINEFRLNGIPGSPE
jgi:hypothetical protein